MDIGIVHFSGAGIRPQQLAVAVEERGFESLFYTEHTHIPLTTRRADGSSARDYATTYDPFVALAAAAAVTQRLVLGTAVTLLAQRDAIITAKELASLDQLSGGRVLVGIGTGWNRPEIANHGVDPATRAVRTDEVVAAMRQIWTRDEAQFHGTHVDFDPIWSWPKPHRPSGPPILVGGNGRQAEDRALAIGDGWLPQCGPLESVADLGDRIERLQRRVADAGRGRLPITAFGVPHDRGLLAEFAEIGVDRCLLPVRSDDATTADVLHTLDTIAGLRDRPA